MGKKTGSGTVEGTSKESKQETVQLRRRERKGHRAYLKYVGAELKGLLEPYREEQRAKAVQLKSTLSELLDVTKELDDEILRLLVEIEDVSDEEIAEEIRCAGDLRGEFTALVSSANEALGGHTSHPQISPQEHSSNGSNNSASVQVRLPKLEAKRFAGLVEEWQEFWDGFQSSIHSNPKLSPVDKFSYLRGLLGGVARTAISGLALTEANYEAAIDLLKRRFGKKSTIERAHVNDLLKVQAVFNERDISGLRRLYDSVEVHHRGLQALGVDAATYEGIVVPAILNKVPEATRLQITRGKNHEEWKMEEMLTELLCELELREENSIRSDKNFTREKDQRKFGGGPATASALLAKTWDNLCAYCKGEHAHEHCMNVASVEERKNILRKYGRCFICAKKGHISRDCVTKLVCNFCKKGRHHISICVDYVGHNAYQAPRQLSPAN